MNKRAVEMTTGAVIVIILGIILLVVLIYYFVTGGGNLFDRYLALGGGNANVQTVVQGCQIACSTQAMYDYCRTLKSVMFTSNGQRYKLTCSKLENGGERVLKIVDSAGLEQTILIPQAGLEYCDAIDRAQCDTLTAEAMTSNEALKENAKLKPSVPPTPTPRP